MQNTPPPLWLASQSPRRKMLLETLGLKFQVRVPVSDEAHPTATAVDEVTVENALAKARLVARELGSVPDIVIGADTLVVADEQVLAKPENPQAAKTMLRLLSGREHAVVTGLALVSPKLGTRSVAVRSRIFFRRVSEAEIEQYAATREPYDKAGGYAVQGLASLFVDRIEGSYTNVVGLPIEALLREMAALTGLPAARWFV